jgi:type II secretory pathway component PulJ
MSNPRRDSGYTLIEVLVTIPCYVSVMAISFHGWRHGPRRDSSQERP